MPAAPSADGGTARHRLRAVGNALNLTTPLGLAIARLGHARVVPGPRGLLLGEGYRPWFPVAGAFAVGNVLITRSTWPEALGRLPRLLEHEERHSWQYLYCLGLPYFLAYGGCLVWSVLRTGDRASRNFFERQAGLVAGGYQERPTRPIRPVVPALIRRERRSLARS